MIILLLDSSGEGGPSITPLSMLVDGYTMTFAIGDNGAPVFNVAISARLRILADEPPTWGDESNTATYDDGSVWG